MKMSRYAHHIFKVHIADGFANDCDELIHKCLQLQTIDYQTFCNFWKDFNFGLIYMGRTSGAEIAELSEEVIHIAKHYMVKDTSNIEENIVGLFLVYALIQLQPYSGFACLRIVPDDLPSINRIEVVARRDRRLDVLYILGNVLITSSQYHAAERERGFEAVLRKYLEGYTSIDKLGVRPKGVFFRQNEELDIIRDLGSVTRQYARAKRSLIGDGESDPSLQYINENLSNELNTSLRKVINGLVDVDSDSNDDIEEEYDHFNSVQAIKQKAMSNTVNPMKHLQGVTDRETSQPSPLPKSDLKQPTGKVKTVSPTKPVTNSPKKRKVQPRKGKNKRRKVKQKSESNDSDTEINLDCFNKSNSKDDGNNAQTVNISLEAIPTNQISTNTDNSIQFEIIDQKAPESDSDIVISDSDSEKINQMLGSDEVREMAHVQTKAPIDLSKVSKRTRRDILIVEPKPLVRKKERQDCKRNEIKSKFKKMGMLPVANFKDQPERKARKSKTVKK